MDTYRRLIRFIELSPFEVFTREGFRCEIRICLVCTRDGRRGNWNEALTISVQVTVLMSHFPCNSLITVPFFHILQSAVGGQMMLIAMRLWNRCLTGSW